MQSVRAPVRSREKHADLQKGSNPVWAFFALRGYATTRMAARVRHVSGVACARVVQTSGIPGDVVRLGCAADQVGGFALFAFEPRLAAPGCEHAVARAVLLTSTTTHEIVRGQERVTRGVPAPKRLVDTERSASVYVRPREDALTAVGGVTALPAAPNEKVIGLCGLWSNGALSPETFRSCPPLPRWVRPIAAQAVSAALWATSRDGDWRKPARAALWLMVGGGTISRNECRGGGDELVINPLLLAVAVWSSMGGR